MTEIKKISWQQTIPLRHKVLWPEKPPEHCYVEDDPQGIHFGAFYHGELVCVASIYLKEDQARLRKFATEPAFQRRGIGTLMLQYIIDELRRQAISYFWCDGRESALDFYKRFNMCSEGQRFYKADVPYFKMVLALSDR